MPVGTINYPGSLDTADTLIRAVNAASSTIGAGGVTAVATTVPVTDASTAPASGVAWCGSEAIKYEGKTGTSLTTCTRGFDGTTAAIHAAVDPIYFSPIIAAHHRVHSDALVAIETLLGANGANVATAGHTHPNDHVPVTVLDTASMNLTLTGQQVSADAIFGTTAATIAAGNHTHSYQPLDSDLTTLAANITAAGHALVDDADAAAQRTTLGLVAAGAGDIWVEKAGDTISGALAVTGGVTGGGLDYVSKISFSAAASGSFAANVLSATYVTYVLVVRLTAMSGAADLYLRLRAGGVDATGATDYVFGGQYAGSHGAGAFISHAGFGYWHIGSCAAAAGNEWLAVVNLGGPQLAARTSMVADTTMRRTDELAIRTYTGGHHKLATAYDSVTIMPSAGTFTGTAHLYGRRD